MSFRNKTVQCVCVCCMCDMSAHSKSAACQFYGSCDLSAYMAVCEQCESRFSYISAWREAEHHRNILLAPGAQHFFALSFALLPCLGQCNAFNFWQSHPVRIDGNGNGVGDWPEYSIKVSFASLNHTFNKLSCSGQRIHYSTQSNCWPPLISVRPSSAPSLSVSIILAHRASSSSVRFTQSHCNGLANAIWAYFPDLVVFYMSSNHFTTTLHVWLLLPLSSYSYFVFCWSFVVAVIEAVVTVAAGSFRWHAFRMI